MRTEIQKLARSDSLQYALFSFFDFLTFEALEIRHTYCIYQRLKPKKVAIKTHQIRVQELYFPLGTL